MTPILTAVDLSYLAGIFDGEGTAGVYHHPNKYQYTLKNGTTGIRTGKNVRIAVNMTDVDPVYFLGLCFGGSINKGKTQTGKVLYRWSVSTRQALSAANRLQPFLKNQAKVAQLQSIIDYYQHLDNKREVNRLTSNAFGDT